MAFSSVAALLERAQTMPLWEAVLEDDRRDRGGERAESWAHMTQLWQAMVRCVEEYHIPTSNMSERIREMDRGRANYYNYYTGHTWGEMRRYDLTLNSSVTGIEGAVEIIAAMVRLRTAQAEIAA